MPKKPGTNLRLKINLQILESLAITWDSKINLENQEPLVNLAIIWDC